MSAYIVFGQETVNSGLQYTINIAVTHEYNRDILIIFDGTYHCWR